MLSVTKEHQINHPISCSVIRMNPNLDAFSRHPGVNARQPRRCRRGNKSGVLSCKIVRRPGARRAISPIGRRRNRAPYHSAPWGPIGRASSSQGADTNVTPQRRSHATTTCRTTHCQRRRLLALISHGIPKGSVRLRWKSAIRPDFQQITLYARHDKKCLAPRVIRRVPDAPKARFSR